MTKRVIKELRLKLQPEEVLLRVEGDPSGAPLDATRTIRELLDAGALQERCVLAVEELRYDVALALMPAGTDFVTQLTVQSTDQVKALARAVIAKLGVKLEPEEVLLRVEGDPSGAPLDATRTIRELLDLGLLGKDTVLIWALRPKRYTASAAQFERVNIAGADMVVIRNTTDPAGSPPHDLFLEPQVVESIQSYLRWHANILMPCGPINSGKTTMLSTVMPAMMMADYDRRVKEGNRFALLPLFVHVTLLPTDAVKDAGERIMKALGALARVVNIHTTIPRKPLLLSFLVESLVHHLARTGNCLVLTIDEVQAPIINSSMPEAVDFLLSLKQVLVHLAPRGCLGITGSTLATVLRVMRLVPPNNFVLADAIHKVQLGASPEEPVALEIATRLLGQLHATSMIDPVLLVKTFSSDPDFVGVTNLRPALLVHTSLAFMSRSSSVSFREVAWSEASKAICETRSDLLRALLELPHSIRLAIRNGALLDGDDYNLVLTQRDIQLLMCAPTALGVQELMPPFSHVLREAIDSSGILMGPMPLDMLDLPFRTRQVWMLINSIAFDLPANVQHRVAAAVMRVVVSRLTDVDGGLAVDKVMQIPSLRQLLRTLKYSLHQNEYREFQEALQAKEYGRTAVYEAYQNLLGLHVIRWITISFAYSRLAAKLSKEGLTPAVIAEISEVAVGVLLDYKIIAEDRYGGFEYVESVALMRR